jgi:hypothetical protein
MYGDYGQRGNCPVACARCPSVCEDSATWTDGSSHDCAWYAANDPGCDVQAAQFGASSPLLQCPKV